MLVGDLCWLLSASVLHLQNEETGPDPRVPSFSSSLEFLVGFFFLSHFIRRSSSFSDLRGSSQEHRDVSNSGFCVIVLFGGSGGVARYPWGSGMTP